MPRYFDLVSAICYTLIQKEYTQGDIALSFAHCNAVAGFVRREIELMPLYLQKGMLLMTYGFSFYSLLKTGCFFHNLSSKRRWVLLLAWKYSSFGILRDFIRFYESLSSLAWFSKLEEKS